MNNDDLDQFERTARARLNTELSRVSVPQRRVRIKPRKESGWKRGALGGIAMLALLFIGVMIALNSVHVPQTGQLPLPPLGQPQPPKPIIYTFVRTVDGSGNATGGTINAVDPADGRILWQVKRTSDNPDATSSFSAGPNYWLAGTISPDYTTLYVADSYRVTALNALDGKEVWSQSLINISSPGLSDFKDPTTDRGTVTVVGNNESITVDLYQDSAHKLVDFAANGDMMRFGIYPQNTEPTITLVTYENGIKRQWDVSANYAHPYEVPPGVIIDNDDTRLPINSSLVRVASIPNSPSLIALDQQSKLVEVNLQTKRTDKSFPLNIVDSRSSAFLKPLILSPDSQRVLIDVAPEFGKGLQFWEYDRTTGQQTRIFNQPSQLVQLNYGLDNDTLYGVSAEDIHKNSLYAFENNQPRQIATFDGQIVNFVVGRDLTPEPTLVVAQPDQPQPPKPIVFLRTINPKTNVTEIKAVDPSNGKVLWQHADGHYLALLARNDELFVVDQSSLYALDATTGKQRWVAALMFEEPANVAPQWSDLTILSASIVQSNDYKQILVMLRTNHDYRIIRVSNNGESVSGYILNEFDTQTTSLGMATTYDWGKDKAWFVDEGAPEQPTAQETTVTMREIGSDEQKVPLAIKGNVRGIGNTLGSISVELLDSNFTLHSMNMTTKQVTTVQLESPGQLPPLIMPLQFSNDGQRFLLKIVNPDNAGEWREYDRWTGKILRVFREPTPLMQLAYGLDEHIAYGAIGHNDDTDSLVEYNDANYRGAVQSPYKIESRQIMTLTDERIANLAVGRYTSEPTPVVANAPTAVPTSMNEQLFSVVSRDDRWVLRGFDATINQALPDKIGQSTGRGTPLDVIASPDGTKIFVATDTELHAFDRNSWGSASAYGFDKPFDWMPDDLASNYTNRLLAMSPDGAELYLLRHDGASQVIDVLSPNRLEKIRTILVSRPDFPFMIATAGTQRAMNVVQDNVIQTWIGDTVEGAVFDQTIAAATALPNSDNVLVVVGSSVWQYNAITHSQERLLDLTLPDLPDLQFALTVSSNNRLLVEIATLEQVVMLKEYDLATKKELRTINLQDKGFSIRGTFIYGSDNITIYGIMGDPLQNSLIKINPDNTITAFDGVFPGRLLHLNVPANEPTALPLPPPPVIGELPTPAPTEVIPNMGGSQLWILGTNPNQSDATRIDGWSLKGFDLTNKTEIGFSQTRFDTAELPNDMILDGVASSDGRTIYIVTVASLQAYDRISNQTLWTQYFDKPDVAQELGGQNLPLIAISHDGAELYVQKAWADPDGRGKIWVAVYDAKTGKPLRQLDVNDGMGMMIPSMRGSERILSFVQPNVIWTWKGTETKATITTIQELASPYAVTDFYFTHYLAFVDKAGMLWNYDNDLNQTWEAFDLGLSPEQVKAISKMSRVGFRLFIEVQNGPWYEYDLTLKKQVRSIALPEFIVEHSTMLVGNDLYAVATDLTNSRIVKFEPNNSQIVTVQELPMFRLKRMMLVPTFELAYAKTPLTPVPTPTPAPTTAPVPTPATQAPIVLDIKQEALDDGSIPTFKGFHEGEVAWLYDRDQGIVRFNRDGTSKPLFSNPAWQKPVFMLKRSNKPPLIGIALGNKTGVVDSETQQLVATFDLDTTAWTKINLDNHDFALSPDEQRFAFVSSDRNTSTLVIANLRNSTLQTKLLAERPETDDNFYLFDINTIDWTDQGIYFNSQYSATRVLSKVNPDDESKAQTIAVLGEGGEIAWSNDGKYVASSPHLNTYNAQYELTLLNTVTGQKQTIDQAQALTMAFSPDSYKFAYIKQNGAMYDLIVYSVLDQISKTVASFKYQPSYQGIRWGDDYQWLTVVQDNGNLVPNSSAPPAQMTVFDTSDYQVQAHFGIKGGLSDSGVHVISLQEQNMRLVEPVVLSSQPEDAADRRMQLSMYNNFAGMLYKVPIDGNPISIVYLPEGAPLSAPIPTAVMPTPSR